MSIFSKYQHVSRIGNIEVHNLLDNDNDRYVFPKIDGTNASIWIDGESGLLSCGSRNYHLSSQKDNQGFYAYIYSNPDMVEKYLNLIRTIENLDIVKNNIIDDKTNLQGWIVLYGEWLVPHTVRAYKDDAWRKFYIFDIAIQWEGDINPYYLSFNNDIIEIFDKNNIDYIPPIKIYKKGEEININELINLSRNSTFLVQDGFFGEGIIIKKYGYINKFGRTTWAKIVNENFGLMKQNKDKSQTDIKPIINTIEYQLVSKYITRDVIIKEKHKIENINNGWSNKFLPLLFESVLNSFIDDDLKTILSTKSKMTINFQQLYQLIIEEVKKVIL